MHHYSLESTGPDRPKILLNKVGKLQFRRFLSGRLVPSLLVGMLAIGVIACGDDDDDATGAATTGAATTAAASSSPAVTSTGAAASNTDDARQLAEPVLFKADAAEWDRLVAAAKNEGTVVVSGPGIPALREGIVNGFKEAFGISVDYVTLPPGQLQPRIQQELKTGKVSIDVTMGGSCFLNNQAGILDNTRDLIVDPSLFKDGVWSGGQLRPGFPEPGVPADYYCGLQTALYVMPDLWVNPEKVNPAEITSWKDLLDPKYKGKIATFDPALGGPAGTTIGYLGRLFGNDFVVNLFKGQDAVYSTDLRQQAEWLVRGTYPIVVGLPHQFVEPLLAQGLPGERIFPGDGPGHSPVVTALCRSSRTPPTLRRRPCL